jgi:hypothetical protein
MLRDWDRDPAARALVFGMQRAEVDCLFQKILNRCRIFAKKTITYANHGM